MKKLFLFAFLLTASAKAEPVGTCTEIKRSVVEPSTREKILKVSISGECALSHSSKNGFEAYLQFVQKNIFSKNVTRLQDPEFTELDGLKGLKNFALLKDDEGFINGHVKLTNEITLVTDKLTTLIFQNVTVKSEGRGPAGQTKKADWRLKIFRNDSGVIILSYQTLHHFLWQGMITAGKGQLLSTLTSDYLKEREAYEIEALKDF